MSSSAYFASLIKKPLAFSENTSLLAASSRMAVETKDGATLNVEVFDEFGEASILLLVIPGVCESAETKGVHAIVQGAKDHKFGGKIAVLELEGHGLSSGKRCLCPSFDRLTGHVVETVETVANKLFNNDSSGAAIYLTGSSLGGALAAYAAEKILTKGLHLKGINPIAPAVGLDNKMLPPSVLVFGLKVMASIGPSLQLSLTPYEDPSSYKCPPTTRRNFEGNWPLATSKMLLDVTSSKIPGDVQAGRLSLSNVPSVFVVAGETDQAVPLESILNFYNAVQSPHKDILQLKKAGHDLMFRSKTSKKITKALFDWIGEQEGERK